MTYICPICGYEGKPRQVKRGSGKMELGIYLVLMFPGPLYSLWRRLGLSKVCPNCSADRMVRLNSDAGQIALRQMDMRLGLLPEKKAVDRPVAPRPSEGMVLSDASFSQRAEPEEEATPKPKIDPDVW